MTRKWDVVIVGGGTAGLIAGIASARTGAQTLLIERSGILGGNMATGMNFGGFLDGHMNQVVRGIGDEIVNRVMQLKGGLGHLHFTNKDRWISSTVSADPEIVKYLGFKMIEESGCHLWLYSIFIEGIKHSDKVKSIKVLNKTGISVIEGKCFIDASGDADLCSSMKIPYEQGGGDRQQGVTSIFRVGNVDLVSLERFMEDKINNECKEPWKVEFASLRGDLKYWTPWKNIPGLADRFPKQFAIYYHGNPGDIFINCTHTAINLKDQDDVTKGIIMLRYQVMEIMKFLKEQVPGFSKAYLTHVYDLGIRESRRIIGQYMLTLDDMTTEREFEDVVAMGAYPPDLHDATKGDIIIHGQGWSRKNDDYESIPYNPGYQIPYRCLIPKEIKNVIVAGRCISASFEAQSGTRGIAPCIAIGQAAGTAAALATKLGVESSELDVQILQKKLASDGAYLGRRWEKKNSENND
jgi:hypothetical protein